ncbi:hypothetical protein [Streptomyces sp. NPDC048508]|uniref:hypothetical protein n=1 Tax=Streptomyces sp. NPDC048508 TaxID=3365561 RepID=UPI00371D89B9
MRIPVRGRTGETDGVCPRVRLRRRLLTVTAIAGAIVGAGFVAASTAQAADTPTRHPLANRAPGPADRGAVQKSAAHKDVLRDVGESVGALLGADKPAKPQSKAPAADAGRGDRIGRPSDLRVAPERNTPEKTAGDASVPTGVRTATATSGAVESRSTTRERKGSQTAGAGAARPSAAPEQAAASVPRSTGRALAPVTARLARAATPVTKPAAKTLGRVAAPVGEPLGRAVAPLTRRLAPVTDRLVPVTAPAADALAPVARVLRPVTAPVLRPVTRVLDPVTEPVVSGSGLSTVTSGLGLTPTQPDTETPGGSGGSSGPPAGAHPPAEAGRAPHDGASADPAADDVHGPSGSWSGLSDSVRGADRRDAAGADTASGDRRSGSFRDGSSFPSPGHGLPAAPSGSAPGGTSGPTAGPGAAGAAWTGSDRSPSTPRDGRPASTAWDRTVAGLLYDGRGPRLPG